MGIKKYHIIIHSYYHIVHEYCSVKYDDHRDKVIIIINKVPSG